MNDPTSINHFYADPVLASPAGHALIADILISYFQSQTCTTWAVATGQSFDTAPLLSVDAAIAEAHGLYGGVGQRKGVAPPDKPNDHIDADGNRKIPSGGANHALQLNIPPGRINTRPNAPRAYEEIAPYCVSANDLINPIPPSLFYGSGWHAFHTPPATSPLQVMQYYWYANMPTSKLRIPIQVGAGDVGVYYMREPMSRVGDGSAISCWVDDNFSGFTIISNSWDIGETTPAYVCVLNLRERGLLIYFFRLQLIDHFVSRGSHYVECQLQGEEGQAVPDFRILGIFAT